MGYDRSDSFPFNFEPNGIPFSSESKGKLSPRSYSIQCERKWKYSFLSEQRIDYWLSEAKTGQILSRVRVYVWDTYLLLKLI